MVGTALQAIGLGLASAVGAARAVEHGRTLVLASGDGGFLMGLAEVDFSGVARALGAKSAIIRSLADLAALQEWIDDGAKGTFVADCRITSSVRAPWMSEWMEATQAAKAAVAG